MYCFCLHFSDFSVLFFLKKNLLQFTFEKNNLLCKKREKITCHEEKSKTPPPLDIKWSVPYVLWFNVSKTLYPIYKANLHYWHMQIQRLNIYLMNARN